MSEVNKWLDYFGNELKIGDEVLFVEKDYRNFSIGKIISGAKFGGTLEHAPTNTRRTKTKQDFSQVVLLSAISKKEAQSE